MSVSSVKQRLIKEVVSAYYEAQKEERKSRSDQWNLILGRKLHALGWRVDHPGSDKYVAIKGSLVCKWVGRRGWSQNAVKDMADIRRRLGHAGLGKYLPRMYLFLDSVLMIEQRCEVNEDWEDGTISGADYMSAFNALKRVEIEIDDLCERNMGKVRSQPKIIDGRLKDRRML